MRRSFVQDPETLELVPKEDWVSSAQKTAYVVPDIKGYQSMATGEWISSRSKHREHLRQHRLIEIGNERIEHKPKGPDRAAIRKSVEEAVRRVLG